MSFFKNLKDTFSPKKFKVLVGNKNIALIDEDKIIEYREMPADLFCNVNVSHSNENDGYDNFYFYKGSASQIEYFDTNFSPLKCSYADEIPNVTSIIENYLYKVDGLLYPVSKDDDVRHLTQRSGDILLVTSKSALKELNNSLSLKFAKGNPYVRSINKTNLFKGNSNTTHYIFDYMPFGKFSVDGKIYYEYEPEEIWL